MQRLDNDQFQLIADSLKVTDQLLSMSFIFTQWFIIEI